MTDHGLLSTDLAQVLKDAVEKFEKGEVEHGKLYITKDARDFLIEAEMELLDTIVYLSLEILRIRKLRERKLKWT